MSYNYHLFSIPLNYVYDCVSVFCNFDAQSLCQFTQGSDDQFDWTLNKDSTPSAPNTGPSKDVSSAGQRFVLVFYKLRRAFVWFMLLSHSTHICFLSSFWLVFQTFLTFFKEPVFYEPGRRLMRFISMTISFPGSLSFTKGYINIKRVHGNKGVIVTFFSTARLRLKSIWNIMNFDRFCMTWTPSKIFKRYKKSSMFCIVIRNYDSFSLLHLGYYVYAEASHPRQTGDRAHLVSPSLTGDFCVQFYYHMYGSNMGTLRVFRLTGSQRTIVGAFTGDRGNIWHLTNIDLPAAQTQQVKFGSSRNDNKDADCCDLIMTVMIMKEVKERKKKELWKPRSC